MSFLAPALLVGLLAIAIPIVVHLVQRERARVVVFPSLMFLRKIPNQSVKRRAIRHWPLLLLRALACACLALAFARPFLTRSAAIAAAGGGRDVVILLDRSHSMGYGNHWDRAKHEARRAVRGLGPNDRGTLALFDTDVEIASRSAVERGGLLAAIDRATTNARATRVGPALRAAAGLLESSPLPAREVILISDFQASSWDRSLETRLPPRTTLTPVPVAEAATSNVALVGLTFDRQAAAAGERVTTTARLVNRSAEPVKDREIGFQVDGRTVDTRRVSVDAGALGTVTFAPFALARQPVRVTARLSPDALRIDDEFHAVVTAGGRVPVLILESPTPSPEASLYLARALAVAAAPGFEVAALRSDRVTPAAINAARLIVLNDTRPPSGAAAQALDARVRGGAGLLVVLGERSVWTADAPDLLPGRLGGVADRSGTRGGTLGFVDYGHPVFEIFTTPRSGDLTAARFFRYRRLADPPAVIARFDDGAVAMAERRIGQGVVLVWASALDSYWNDLALKPVFVPLVHQAMKHLGRYVEPRPWYTVGDSIDRTQLKNRPGPATVLEPGFHDVQPADADAGAATAVAVNVASAESDLSPFDPAELVAAVAAPGEGRGGAGAASVLTVEESERRQSVWWYLLAAGLAVLVAEGVLASRLPRIL